MIAKTHYKATASATWASSTTLRIALSLVTMGAASLSVAQGSPDSASAKPFRGSYYACVKASGGVTAALNDCIGTEHEYQDKRLNSAYQQLRKSMTEPQRLSLRDEERGWIASRDKACAADTDGGTGDLLDSNQCALRETAERAIALEARIGK